ncbi:MAG: hypothetical protein DDT37_01010 [Firmicutes bacterium]|nr:hypothetical protein [candidate division NPL-UPA2 bacterium]
MPRQVLRLSRAMGWVGLWSGIGLHTWIGVAVTFGLGLCALYVGDRVGDGA